MSTCETVMITPAQAKTLREAANFELQRPMSEGNVVRLRLEMDAGKFVPGTPIYFAVLPDKTMLALNGNHTLAAVGRGAGAVELTMIYQDVGSLAEAAAIYARLDLHKMRSWRDALRAYGAESMLSESTVWTAAFAAAIGMMLGKFEERSRYGTGWGKSNVDEITVQLSTNRELRLKLMKAAEPSAQLYVTAAGGNSGPKSVFKRASVMGPGIEIMRYQPSAGAEFFAGMAADDGLHTGDPRRTLLRWLRENASPGMAARIRTTRAVAAGWNAFFQKRQLEIIRASASQMILAGTPWNGTFEPVDAYAPELLKPKAEAPAVRKTVKTGVSAHGKPVAIHA